MTDRRPPADIDAAAIDWLARSERGLSQSEEVELDQWLNQDSRHLGAFVRAQAAWIHAERATALGSMPEPAEEPVAHDEPVLVLHPVADETETPQRAGLGRRAFLMGTGAVAASVAGASLFLHKLARTIESSFGEVRHLALADGTRLVLDTNTRVEVQEGTGDRRLKLIFGKIFLDVAPGSTRSLVVEAAGLAMDMTQGAFGLQALADEPLFALVTDGLLTVSQGGGLFQPKHSVAVAKGQGFTLALGKDLASAHIAPVIATQLDQFLAWRDGMLSFSGEALSTAVRAFDRYSTKRIEIPDAWLATQPITGLFKADDPKGFATAIAASFGALVATNGDVIRIYKKTSG